MHFGLQGSTGYAEHSPPGRFVVIMFLRHPTCHRQRVLSGPEGQALAEFALVLPVLMLILLAIIQLGFMLGGQIGLINAVRETARFGSLAPTTEVNAATNGSSVDGYLTTSSLPLNVPGFEPANLVSHSVTYCQYQNPGAASYSVRLTVVANYRHPLFIPMVGLILDGFDGSMDGGLAVTTREQFRVENPPLNLSEVDALAVCP
jgi:Flp pilus assembly protein TadG